MGVIPERINAGPVTLVMHGPDDAAEIADVINASIDHLRPWMAWAQRETTPQEQAFRLAMVLERARAGEDGGWSIVDASGAIVGGCGLHARTTPDERDVGYWLAPWAEGRGYATSAAAALTAVAFEVVGVERVRITCDEANVRSAAVPARLGYVHRATVDDEIAAPGEVGRSMIWVIEREAWSAQRSAGRFRSV